MMTFGGKRFFATRAWWVQMTAWRVLVFLALPGGLGEASAGPATPNIELGRGGFTIVVAAGEAPAVQRAVEALRRDFLGVLGLLPAVQPTLPSPASGPGSSAPRPSLDCRLSVAGKDSTPAAFLLAGASDAKWQNTKVKLTVIPKYFWE